MPARGSHPSFGYLLYLGAVLLLTGLASAGLASIDVPIHAAALLSAALGLLASWPAFTRLRRALSAQAAGAGESAQEAQRGLFQQVERAAAQQERNRLARELHDSIKQQLFSIQMSAASAQLRFGDDAAAALQALEDVRKSTQEAMVEMNALLQQLSPMPLERAGLAQALREQCEALGFRSGAEVACEIGDLPPNAAFRPGAQEELFRIAQEGLSNVARHARAGKVTLRLGWHEELNQVELDLQDNGQGFDPDEAEPGRGLANIRERLERLGGWMKLTSSAGHGTRLQVGIPLQSVEAPAEPEDAAPGPSLNRPVLPGIAFGIFTAAALGLAWYFNTPLRYVPGWRGVNELAAAAGYLAAGGILFLAGWLAGRRAPEQAALAGAACGLTAALTAFGLAGAAWASMQGAGALLSNGLMFVPDESAALRIIQQAATGIFTVSHGLYWMMMLVGAGFGALGGFVAARGRPLRLPVNWQPGLQFLLLPFLVSSALASLAGVFLLPAMETGLLNALQRSHPNDLAGGIGAIRLSAAVCLFTLAAFYLGGLALRHSYAQKALPGASPARLVDLHWDSFWMATGSGVWAAAAVYISLQYLAGGAAGTVDGAAKSVFAPSLGLVMGGLSLVMSLLFARLCIAARDRLVQSLLPTPALVEYAGLVGVPVALIGAFLLIILGGNGWLALGVLVIETGLLVYGVILRRRRKANRAMTGRAIREQAGWLRGSWAAYAGGFVAPVLAMLASGLGILLLPARMAQYLDIGRLPYLALPPLTLREVIEQLFFYEGAAFLGLLLLALMQTGLTLLALSMAGLRGRKGL